MEVIGPTFDSQRLWICSLLVRNEFLVGLQCQIELGISDLWRKIPQQYQYLSTRTKKVWVRSWIVGHMSSYTWHSGHPLVQPGQNAAFQALDVKSRGDFIQYGIFDKCLIRACSAEAFPTGGYSRAGNLEASYLKTGHPKAAPFLEGLHQHLSLRLAMRLDHLSCG